MRAYPEIMESATAARCPLSSSLSDSAFLTASSAPSLLRSSSEGLPEDEILSLACRSSFSILSWPGTSVCRDEYLHSCQSGVPFLRNSLHLVHQRIMASPPRSFRRQACLLEILLGGRRGSFPVKEASRHASMPRIARISADDVIPAPLPCLAWHTWRYTSKKSFFSRTR